MPQLTTQRIGTGHCDFWRGQGIVGEANWSPKERQRPKQYGRVPAVHRGRRRCGTLPGFRSVVGDGRVRDARQVWNTGLPSPPSGPATNTPSKSTECRWGFSFRSALVLCTTVTPAAPVVP